MSNSKTLQEIESVADDQQATHAITPSLKVYRVEMERVFYVVAENAADAEYDTEFRHARDDDTDPEHVHAIEVTDRRTVPADWLSSLPWGDDDNRTVAQWLEKPEPPFVEYVDGRYVHRSKLGGCVSHLPQRSHRSNEPKVVDMDKLIERLREMAATRILMDHEKRTLTRSANQLELQARENDQLREAAKELIRAVGYSDIFPASGREPLARAIADVERLASPPALRDDHE